jgi:hypothetical protein
MSEHEPDASRMTPRSVKSNFQRGSIFAGGARNIGRAGVCPSGFWKDLGRQSARDAWPSLDRWGQDLPRGHPKWRSNPDRLKFPASGSRAKSNRNSSPPLRPHRSTSRRLALTAIAKLRRTSSPSGCPNRALIRLKKYKSMIAIGRVAPLRAPFRHSARV